MAHLLPTLTDLQHVAIWLVLWTAAGLLLAGVWVIVTMAADAIGQRRHETPPIQTDYERFTAPRSFQQPAAKGFDRRSVYDLHRNDPRRG